MSLEKTGQKPEICNERKPQGGGKAKVAKGGLMPVVRIQARED